MERTRFFFYDKISYLISLKELWVVDILPRYGRYRKTKPSERLTATPTVGNTLVLACVISGYYSFVRKLWILSAASRPFAMAVTTRLAPLAASPAANTLFLVV